MRIANQFLNAARRLMAHLARIIKPSKDRVPEAWYRRLAAMRECRTTEQMEGEFGLPAHKLPQGEMQAWHYPLGVVGGLCYSIHVITSKSEVSQVYMHTEPASPGGKVETRPQLPRGPGIESILIVEGTIKCGEAHRKILKNEIVQIYTLQYLQWG